MKFLKIIFLLFIAIATNLSVNRVLAQGSVTSSFVPPTATAASNQDFTVNVRLNSASTLKVRMYQINVNFDTSKVQVKSINYRIGIKSDVLGGDDDQNLAQINSSGQIKLIGELNTAAGFTLPQGVATSFVELTFTSQSAGQYSINILSTSFLKNVKADLFLETISISPSSMTVNQAPPPPSPSPSPTPTPTSIVDRASCSTAILNRDSLQVIVPPISSAQRLIFRVNMTNQADTIWGKDTYKLKASSDTLQQWGLSKDTFKITDPESKNKNDIRKNQSVVFDIPARAAQVNAPSSQVFKFSMVNAADEEFTDACISQDIVVNPPPASPSPTPPPVGTTCFFMDDKPITGRSCTDAGARVYDIHPKTVPLTLTTVGKKTIFVRFVSNLGVTRDFQRVINFTPDPKITESDCTHSPSGSGSIVTITGTALGAQGKGKVKVGGADATIITWNETTGVITASLDKRIEGKNDIELTRDDGKVARGECTLGTTSVVFAAQTQCKTGGNFTADNVSVKIFANVPAAIDAEKSEPVIDQKIKLDKDGKPSGFTPKLEKNKKYSLIVKTPGSLAKRVDFETKGGTRNLDAVILPVGDIAPSANADGKINAFDKSELIRQWSLIRDVQRSGDFNQDGRVNSIDYACMRQNINKSDEEFSPPTVKASPAPASSPSPSPSPAPTASPSPTPAGGTGGTLFRVSFNPAFPAGQTIEGNLDEITNQAVIDLILPNSGQNSVYVQFFENGVWGPTPPQTASILLQ